ncbi:ABC transporter ATP-binding protein [Amycolatopsis sp. NPDC021455]|uniref:ABC transporter ATP-binding protein n=1 Tax=Amycolatopsis sp. NPDC021455 TaxID=3154901 RepID=UPI0033F62E63
MNAAVSARPVAVDAAAIEVDELVVRYGGKTAVDGVSFSLARGQVLALLGPNGAGKTSIVECCEGYRAAAGGTVRILGLDPGAHHDRLMPRIGIMLQSGGVYPRVTPADMLALFASFAAHPLDVGVLIERMGLTRFARTPYLRLSGGEKQRLGMALALVGRPEVVFLDEPTAGMDLQARHATWELVSELRADGVAVLLTTHLLDEAERLADDVVIVDRGRVLASGSPRELTAAAGIDRVTIRARPGLPLADLLARFPGELTAAETAPGDYLLTGVLDTRGLALVAAWCAAEDAGVTSLRTERRTLEDVFLTLTGGKERR